MKQTSVEWLVDKLSQTDTDIYLHMNQLELSKSYFKDLIEQAKAMEKENLKDFYFGGINYELYPTSKGFEEYYSETFKSE